MWNGVVGVHRLYSIMGIPSVCPALSAPFALAIPNVNRTQMWVDAENDALPFELLAGGK